MDLFWKIAFDILYFTLMVRKRKKDLLYFRISCVEICCTLFPLSAIYNSTRTHKAANHTQKAIAVIVKSKAFYYLRSLGRLRLVIA